MLITYTLTYMSCIEMYVIIEDLYDPLNPDKDTIRVRADLSYSQQQEALMAHLRPLLGMIHSFI